MLVLLLTNSCTQKLYMMYAGMHEPRVETTESLRKYMRKVKMTSDNVFTTQNIESFQNQLFFAGGSVPEALIFNKNLDNIIYRDTNECNAHAFSAILELDKNKTYQINDLVKFNDINAGLCDLEGNPTKITVNDNSDFLVVIYWAKFTGRLNKDHVNIWEKDAINNTNSNIQVVKINLDQLSFWENE